MQEDVAMEISILNKLLQLDGEVAILCAVLLLLLVMFWRENRRLHEELNKAQQARIDDAKATAKSHIELVDRIRSTTEGTNQALNTIKDLFAASGRRDSK